MNTLNKTITTDTTKKGSKRTYYIIISLLFLSLGFSQNDKLQIGDLEFSICDSKSLVEYKILNSNHGSKYITKDFLSVKRTKYSEESIGSVFFNNDGKVESLSRDYYSNGNSIDLFEHLFFGSKQFIGEGDKWGDSEELLVTNLMMEIRTLVNDKIGTFQKSISFSQSRKDLQREVDINYFPVETKDVVLTETIRLVGYKGGVDKDGNFKFYDKPDKSRCN
jgi:hypothetical protein